MHPLPAHSWAEARLYLKVAPCEQCSRGPWEVTAGPEETAGQSLRARCLNCGAEKEFTFQCPAPSADQGRRAPVPKDLPVELINPSGSPSEIIDVGQWLSLFYHLVEQAGKVAEKGRTRRLTFQAAQCLDEALKFYSPDDELPPRSGFFTKASREAFTKHPEGFARQRLRDMRSKLPDLRLMIGRLDRDARKRAHGRWWQFWKR